MIDERVIVEKLDVKPGELVLVIAPDDSDSEYMDSLAHSFVELAQEAGATFFVVPESLRFKVIRESEA